LDAERAQAELHEKKEQPIQCGQQNLVEQAQTARRLDPLWLRCVLLSPDCAVHAEGYPQKIQARTTPRPAHVRSAHAARLTLTQNLAGQKTIPRRRRRIPRAPGRIPKQILSENPHGSLCCCYFLLIAGMSCSEHCFDQNFRLLLRLDELHPVDHKEQHL
jgi:hypothetical protein